MYWLACTIEFQRLKPIRTPVGVTITRGWAQRADTCTLELPRGVQLRSGTSLRDAIRQGDSVSVKLGYNDRLRTEFQGYVTTPPKAQAAGYVIACEDAMFALRQSTVSVSYADAHLPTLVSEIAPDTPAEVLDARFGPYRKTNASPAAILADLAEQYQFRSYFRGGTLYVGFRYPDNPPEVRYDFSRNIQAHSLTFKRAEDMQLQIKATSVQKDGSRISVTVPEGDTEGYSTQEKLYMHLTESELRKRAEAELAKQRYDGYEGEFTAWGRPYIEHGWTVRLRNPKYPEYDGKYSVDKVATTFGTDGFARTITLGPRVL
jgi:hypothetical protein